MDGPHLPPGPLAVVPVLPPPPARTREPWSDATWGGAVDPEAAAAEAALEAGWQAAFGDDYLGAAGQVQVGGVDLGQRRGYRDAGGPAGLEPTEATSPDGFGDILDGIFNRQFELGVNTTRRRTGRAGKRFRRQSRMDEFGIRVKVITPTVDTPAADLDVLMDDATENDAKALAAEVINERVPYESIADVWSAGDKIMPANMDEAEFIRMIEPLSQAEKELAKEERRTRSKRHGAQVSDHRLKHRIASLEKVAKSLIDVVEIIYGTRHPAAIAARDVLYPTDKPRRTGRKTKPLPVTKKVPRGVGRRR